MEARKAASSQPLGTKISKRRSLGVAALGVLIGSLIPVVGWGALLPAPPGSRADVALLWLGAWAATSLVTFPFTCAVTIACRLGTLKPRRALLITSVFSLVLAALFGLLVLRSLSPAWVYDSGVMNR